MSMFTIFALAHGGSGSSSPSTVGRKQGNTLADRINRMVSTQSTNGGRVNSQNRAGGKINRSVSSKRNGTQNAGEYIRANGSMFQKGQFRSNGQRVR